jgi:predicted GNAT superfamily acetyltransferase
MNAIHDLTLADAPVMLSLNNAHASETSGLDEAGIRELLTMAFYARGIDRGATALLLALDQDALYRNPNFEWFKCSPTSFVYIDRIIVAAAARGLGIGRLLYDDLFAAAIHAGHNNIVCEVNVDPPNPASVAFHQKLGFNQVGQGSIHGGAKTVRYFEKTLG